MTGKRVLLFGISAMLTLILAAGCSDDGGSKTPDKGITNPDIGITDSTVDFYSDGPIADQPITPDMPVTDTTVDTTPTEAGPDGPVADMPVVDIGPVGDMPVTDGPVGDAPPGPGNDTCANAKLLTLVSGSVTETGDTTTAYNEFGTDVTCGTSYDYDGVDVYYKVNLVSGKAYMLTLSPTDGTNDWDGALYAFKASTGCSSGTAIDTACTGYVADNGSSGDDEVVVINATATEDWIIVVDSYSTSESGPFTLKVEEFTPPANDTCATAQAVTLTSGKGTVTGTKVGATNALAQCGTASMGASDLWYKFTPTVGKTYKVTFKPDGTGGRFGVWEGSSCVAADVETACGVLGYKYVSGGSSAVTVITSTAGDIYFVADGLDSSYDVYGFTFDVEEVTVPANDTCAAATAITLVNGSATETGDTIGATNKVDLTASDCTGDTTSGPDVFYKVDLTGGTTYKISLDGSSFNAALYVFTDCANVATTCGQGMGADDWSSSTEEVSVTPTANGTYYIAVDGRGATDMGSYTLKISEAPANDTCANAIPLTFSSGTATASGDNTAATDAITLSSSGCTGYSTSGYDMFYRVTLTANQQYTITLTPDANWDPTLYVFTDCAQPESTCQTGWGSDNVGDGVAETVTITPTTTGTFFIGVDAWSSSEVGTFTLEVK